MRLSVRVNAWLGGVTARLRAMAMAGPRDDDASESVKLPSTSNLRDPREILALSRFDQPPSDTS